MKGATERLKLLNKIIFAVNFIVLTNNPYREIFIHINQVMNSLINELCIFDHKVASHLNLNRKKILLEKVEIAFSLRL